MNPRTSYVRREKGLGVVTFQASRARGRSIFTSLLLALAAGAGEHLAHEVARLVAAKNESAQRLAEALIELRRSDPARYDQAVRIVALMDAPR